MALRMMRWTGCLFDGMTIAAGGFGLCGIPELLIDAIARQARRIMYHRVQQLRGG
jgi:acyl CoA:acetate/3-ketoacid CoA transferase alpha subunit